MRQCRLNHVAVIAAVVRYWPHRLSACVCQGRRWTFLQPSLTVNCVNVVDYTISYELTSVSASLHLIRIGVVA